MLSLPALCQLTLFHWHGVCFTVSIPLCSARLSFHFVSPSLLCFSLKQRGEREMRGGYLAGNRRAPADFLTHSSSVKSKPTEAKSGYYLSCISSVSHSATVGQALWNSLVWNEAGGSRSVRKIAASWIWLARDQCIHKNNTEVWTSDLGLFMSVSALHYPKEGFILWASIRHQDLFDVVKYFLECILFF